MKLKKSGKLVLMPNTLDPNSDQTHIQYQPGYPNVKFEIPQRILYHYTSFDNAQHIIEGHCLKFSSPETFNDPFDLYDGLVDFECRSNSQIRDWVNMMSPTASSSVKQKLRYEIEHGDRKGFEQKARDYFAHRRRESGVCCFSMSPEVSLMWSHYAHKHTGVCFGFEFMPVGVLEGIHMNMRIVRYISQIQPVNYYSKMAEAFQYWIESKSEVWAYEKEVRAFINDRHGFDLFPFAKSCLKEIYFGCRVDAVQQLQILNLLKEKGYQVAIKRQMIIDPSIYSVKAVEL